MGKNKEFKVKPESKHLKIKPKWYVLTYEWIRKGINFFIGGFITWYLFDKCLFCSDCNTAVIIHLSIIAFICFINCGIQIDKLVKINSVAGS